MIALPFHMTVLRLTELPAIAPLGFPVFTPIRLWAGVN
jgi:hypothetical protein